MGEPGAGKTEVLGQSAYVLQEAGECVAALSE